MTFAAHRSVGPNPESGGGFGNFESGYCINLFPSKRTVSEQQGPGVIKAGAAGDLNQSHRNVGRGHGQL